MSLNNCPLMSRQKSVVVDVNDVLEELKEENDRLLKELLIANKCLKMFTQYKTFVESTKLQQILDSNELLKYQELNENVNQMMKNYDNESDRHFDGSNGDNDLINTDKDFVVEQKPQLKSSNNKESIGSKVNEDKREVIINYISQSTAVPLNDDISQRSDKLKNIIRDKNTNEFVCHFKDCDKRFKCRQNYKFHIWKHEDREKLHSCLFPGCDYKCNKKAHLTSHMTTHTGEKPFKCWECTKSFGVKESLKNHRERYHNALDQPLVCDIDGCGKQFQTNLSLNTHQRSIHPKTFKFVCEHQNCNYKSGSKFTYLKHLCTHSDDRPFKCHIDGCDKSFKSKQGLDFHLYHTKLHSTENEDHYQCPHEGCLKLFKFERLMKFHLDRYHSVDKYWCEWPGCDYKTNTKQKLTTHRPMHSDERQYSCSWPLCDKRFKRPQELKHHLRIHNGDKKFVCSWPGCNYRCVFKGNLKKHMTIHQK